MNSWIGDLLCLVAGALLTLSFSPFGIFPLAILSPAILFALWLNISYKKAFWRGFLFGVGFFGTGVHWIFYSIHVYSNAPLWVAILTTALFVVILALFPAFNGYFLNKIYPKNHPTKLLCALPASWVLFEWIRSWIFSGFPWLYLGYSQMDSPLKGYAPIFSVYGVSLAVALSSALLVFAILSFNKRQAKNIYFALFTLALIWVAGSLLSFVNWTKPLGEPIKTSLIQGDIPQELKWTRENLQLSLDTYKNLSEQNWSSSLIIWPEAAIPLVLQDAAQYLGTIGAEAIQHHSAIITGIPLKLPNYAYQNTVLGLGIASGLYIKERLVPFGEFIPLKHLLGNLLGFLGLPMSDMVPGARNLTPIFYKNIQFATFICYEICFPEQVRNQDGKVGVILTVTDDAWFGRSVAQAQHIEMARMRAYETGRPVLFVSNNGITAFITPTGKIQSAAPPYQQAVLTDTVQPMQGHTPWLSFGMDPILMLLFVLLVIAYWRMRDGKGT